MVIKIIIFMVMTIWSITCWELFVSVGPPPLWVSLSPILKIPLLIISPLLWAFQMIHIISSQNLCQLRFFGFTNFLDGKVFATKKLVAARYGSGAKTASLQIWFFETKLREIAVQLFGSSLYVHFMQRPLPTITICNQHWKQLFRARHPNTIFTQNRGQDLFELIYHLIKGSLEFWTGAGSKSFQG